MNAAPAKGAAAPDSAEPRPKKPFLKFFPADWRSDPKLRACSLPARGLWIEVIGLMHEAEPYGYLRINGHAPNLTELARQVGATPAEVKRALGELKANDVCSATADGTLYCRRLVRIGHRAVVNATNGQLGAEGRWGQQQPGSDAAAETRDDVDGEHDGEHDGKSGGHPDGEQHGPIFQSLDARSPLPPRGGNELPGMLVEAGREEAFIALWNTTTTPPLPRCRDLTQKRRRHIRARLAERQLTEWGDVMARINASDFCRGQVSVSSDRGQPWVASIDWLIRSPDTAVKVLEGAYDNRAGRRVDAGGVPNCRHRPVCRDAQACSALMITNYSRPTSKPAPAAVGRA